MTELVRRWAKPINVLAVSEDGDSFVRFNEGEGWYRGARFVTDEEGWQRIRDGQVCLMCMEPQAPPAPNPIPERCSLCGYEMRKYQREHLDLEFRGEEHVGPSTSLADELERLDDTADRMKWDRDPKTSLLIPRGVS